MKVKNLLFAILFVLFVSGPSSLFVATKAQIDIPSDLTAEPAKYLFGGINDVNTAAAFTLSGFLSGNLQKDLEAETNNFIPCKSFALLSNAAIQRNFITVSNTAFGFNCYPTYYGSDYLFVPCENSIMKMPMKQSEDWDANFLAFVNSASRWSSEHPNIKIVIGVVGSGSISALNPAYPYVSNSKTYEDVVNMLNSTNGNCNLTFVFTEYENYHEYYEDYFRTDHHWNMRGAYKMYKKITTILDLPLFGSASQFNVEQGVFTGSYGRGGLMSLVDNVPLLMDDYSMLRIIDDKKEDQKAVKYTIPNLPLDDAQKYNYPPYCYGGLSSSTIIGGLGSKDILLVADSFEEGIHRMLAKSSRTLFSKYYLHLKDKNDLSLSECLASNPSSAVVFIAAPEDYASFVSRHPNWFK